MSDLPEIGFGDRFQISSRRGSEYQVTCLGYGEGKDFFYVRLDDGRIARLDRGRLNWETFSDLPDGGSPLEPEDKLIVECSSGTMRGSLDEQLSSDGLRLRLPVGGAIPLPWDDVEELFLLFRAPDLKRGDLLSVSSRSGNYYHGKLLAVIPGDCLRLRLREGGDVVNLKIGKLDLKSILVTISLPVERLRERCAAGA